MDEIRIYLRVLSAGEVALIAGLNPIYLTNFYCVCLGDRGFGIGALPAPICTC